MSRLLLLSLLFSTFAFGQQPSRQVYQKMAGVTNGSSAAAGNIGEYISAASGGGGIGVTNGEFTNCISITLTAGDWDVIGVIEQATDGTAALGGGALSLYSNNTTTDHAVGDNFLGMPFVGTAPSMFAGAINLHLRVSFTGSSKNVYLKANSTRTGGTVTNSYCAMYARRIR